MVCAPPTLGDPAAAAEGRFRPGPVVVEISSGDLDSPLGSVSWQEARESSWRGLDRTVAEALEQRGAILLVGETDPVGPRALNHSLGLQYASHTARLLAASLGVEPWRFRCASTGESPGGQPRVSAYAWEIPTEPDLPGAGAVLLDPVPGLPSSGRIWGFWDPGASSALWVTDFAGEPRVFGVDPGERILSLPFPPGAASAAIGAYQGRVVVADGAEVGPESDSTEPSVSLLAVEPWSARVRVSVAKGTSDPILWASGVPYRLTPGPDGTAEVPVLLLPEPGEARLQVRDGLGRALTARPLRLPAGEGDPPTLVAVLVWEGEGVDLDLHGWTSAGHTHPQDPDPAFSSTAAPGTRHLFDGGSTSRASALAVWGVEKISLEARCYSDLGTSGATAWLYVFESPADPLRVRRTVLGPRRLSGEPLRARWPALSGIEIPPSL